MIVCLKLISWNPNVSRRRITFHALDSAFVPSNRLVWALKVAASPYCSALPDQI